MLLSPFYHPRRVSRVIILSRDPERESIKALVAIGAVAHALEGPVDASQLRGVDVLVNTLGGAVTNEIKNQYATAALEAGVKVYMPSAFGA